MPHIHAHPGANGDYIQEKQKGRKEGKNAEGMAGTHGIQDAIYGKTYVEIEPWFIYSIPVVVWDCQIYNQSGNPMRYM
jgi:hypothetical protein